MISASLIYSQVKRVRPSEMSHSATDQDSSSDGEPPPGPPRNPLSEVSLQVLPPDSIST